MLPPPADAFTLPPQVSVALTTDAKVTFAGRVFEKLTVLTGVLLAELSIVQVSEDVAFGAMVDGENTEENVGVAAKALPPDANKSAIKNKINR